MERLNLCFFSACQCPFHCFHLDCSHFFLSFNYFFVFVFASALSLYHRDSPEVTLCSYFTVIVPVWKREKNEWPFNTFPNDTSNYEAMKLALPGQPSEYQKAIVARGKNGGRCSY